MDVYGVVTLGFLAGWLASRLLDSGVYRFVGDIFVGICGALGGAWLASQLLGTNAARLDLLSGFAALGGALAMIVVFSMLGPGRKTLGQIVLGR